MTPPRQWIVWEWVQASADEIAPGVDVRDIGKPTFVHREADGAVTFGRGGKSWTIPADSPVWLLRPVPLSTLVTGRPGVVA